MTRTRLWKAVLATAMLAASTATPAATPAAAWDAPADGPLLHLSQTTAALGTWITVDGTGFAPGARYQLAICGIGGTSNSCDVTAAAFAVVGAQGTFRQDLQVHEPPTPCPCTVHAAPYGGPSADPVDAALSIPGLRYMPEAAKPVPGMAKLLDVSVADDSPLLTQFGADGSARVTVTVTNLAGGPAGDPGIVLVLNRAGKTAGTYPVRWSGGPLAAGSRRSLVYDVPLPGGWFRDYGIGVQVADAGGRPVTVRTVPASVRPWGEPLAPAVLLLGVGLIVLGRRRGHAAAAAGAAGAAGPGSESGQEPESPETTTAPGEPDPEEAPEVPATDESD